MIAKWIRVLKKSKKNVSFYLIRRKTKTSLSSQTPRPIPRLTANNQEKIRTLWLSQTPQTKAIRSNLLKQISLRREGNPAKMRFYSTLDPRKILLMLEENH